MPVRYGFADYHRMNFPLCHAGDDAKSRCQLHGKTRGITSFLVTGGLHSLLCQLAGDFDFRLASNSSRSLGVIIFTLAMCGPRERYGESSFGGGVPLPAGAVVGAGVAGVGFVATAGAL